MLAQVVEPLTREPARASAAWKECVTFRESRGVPMATRKRSRRRASAVRPRDVPRPDGRMLPQGGRDSAPSRSVRRERSVFGSARAREPSRGVANAQRSERRGRRPASGGPSSSPWRMPGAIAVMYRASSRSPRTASRNDRASSAVSGRISYRALDGGVTSVATFRTTLPDLKARPRATRRTT